MSDLRDIATLCKEIDYLTTQVDTLRKERDESKRAVSSKATGGNIYLALVAEVETLRSERDEVRQSYCSLMEAYRGGNGRVTANKLGWGYLFEEDKPCQ